MTATVFVMRVAGGKGLECWKTDYILALGANPTIYRRKTDYILALGASSWLFYIVFHIHRSVKACWS
jgi:hypothetical protein